MALNLPEHLHSHPLRRLAVREAVRGSFDTAHAAIVEQCGPVVGKRQIEQLTVAMAADIDAFYTSHAPLACTDDTLLVLSADGKGVVMCPEALREQTRKAAELKGSGTYQTRLSSGEKPNRKRMATLGAVYDAEPKPRDPHDVITLADTVTDEKNDKDGLRPRKGPVAFNKWLTGSVGDSSEKVIASVFDQAEQRDPHHRRTWLVLVDGVPHQLETIRSEATRRQVKIHILIDIIHVLEYAWRAAWTFHARGEKAAEYWVADHALTILKGHSEKAAADIDAQATAAGLTPDQRKGADTCINYLKAKAEFLAYDTALTAGRPIATGIIEGACCHLIGGRLDITGARWDLAGAEAILKLRALHSNGDIDAYWAEKVGFRTHSAWAASNSPGVLMSNGEVFTDWGASLRGVGQSTDPATSAAHHDPLVVTSPEPTLYNDDLAPVPHRKRKWGAFEIFNVWSNDIQSLFGYTLAATLFMTSGLNGWWVLAGIVLAGFIVMLLVNLTGKASVEYGIPYPVLARVSMGVHGAQFPALVRGVVAIFWYGVQTYFASTAIALLITAVTGYSGGEDVLGMSSVGWVSYLFVAAFQLWLFLRGIDWITRYLNWVAPMVYVVMVALTVVIWAKAGSGLLTGLGNVFTGGRGDSGTPIAAFVGVVGTMLAYFAAVIINYGDFSRFVKTQRQMKRGNFYGLPVSLALFSFLALVITAGTDVLFGEALTNPADIVERVDNVWLTVVAALTFFAATVGINLVANFIPAAYDLANTSPDIIGARTGGIITAVVAFVVGALWVAAFSILGITKFVDTLGALLAPLYGITVIDYYLIRKQRINVQDLFSAEPGGTYHYSKGWNIRALAAFGLASVFSVATVWEPAMKDLTGFAWIFGAALGAVLHYLLMGRSAQADPSAR